MYILINVCNKYIFEAGVGFQIMYQTRQRLIGAGHLRLNQWLDYFQNIKKIY